MNPSILFCIFNLFWCAQLSAEESALQMANRPSLEALWCFVTHSTGINASRLIGIPCLYKVLEYHKSKGEGYPGHLLSLCKWMCQQGESLLKSITAPSVTYSIVDLPADLTIPHCWWAIQSQLRISCSHCWWVGRLVCYVHYIWIGWELWVEFFNWLARNCKRSNNSMLYRQAELVKNPLATDWPA